MSHAEGSQDDMTSHGLRSLLAGLRSALAGDAPSDSRLQLSITSSQPSQERASGVGGAGEAAASLPEQAAAEAGAAAAQQGLLQSSLSSGLLAQSEGSSSPPLPSIHSPVAASAGNLGSHSIAESADVAAAAEHHRLTNLSSSIDLRAAALALERGLPYIILLLFLFVSTHVVGISVYTYLSLVLFRLNVLIRGQVALKHERQARPLLAAAAVAAVHVPVVLVALQGRDLAGNLVLGGTQHPAKFWDVVFAVVVGDALLRYLAVVVKAGVLLWMTVDSPTRLRRRGAALTAADHCFACYRLLPPAPLWYHFFSRAAVGGILQTGLSGAYLLVKAQHLFEHGSLAALALKQVAARGYGSVPTPDETHEAGNTCPICQDAYREPVKLPCGHIFCADCCGEWFERERSCPMCRAPVGPSNKRFKSAADGRTSLLPVIF